MTKTEDLKSALVTKGLRYVGIRGNPAAPVCLLGEAPGADEDREGLPFVGSSGKELGRMLGESGLSERDCWFTNTYKTRPPENKLDRLAELGVADSLFTDQILEELYEHKPTIIIPCGATGLGLLCPNTLDRKSGHAAITKWRGSLLQSAKLDWPHYVIPTLHPAFILRAWDMRQEAVLCLAKAGDELKYYQNNRRLLPPTERSFLIDPSFYDTIDYLRDCYEHRRRVALDIENLGKSEAKRFPSRIAVATSAFRALSFSFGQFGGREGAEVWRRLNDVLRYCPQIGQNFTTHDGPWLEYIGLEPNVELLDDTLIRHHVLWPELSHKLDFQTFQYTREPYYKDEGKYPKDRRQFAEYNGKDSAVDFEIWERQEEEFAEQPRLGKFYSEYQMPLARKFFRIDQRGLLTDKIALQELRSDIKTKLATACKAIAATTGYAEVVESEDEAKARGLRLKSKKLVSYFNLGSSPQVADALRKLNLRVPTKRVPGAGTRETTDEESLQTLFAETGNEFLKDVLTVRELNKMLSTYVDASLSHDILYCSYVVSGTVTGRRSSRSNFLGLGSNQQNLPKHSDLGKRYRKCLISRPGRVFVACDQVQAEDWIVQGIIADQSGDTSGLDELRAGVDRHKKLAAFIFGLPEDKCGKDTPERFLGKKVRHAGNYDMGAFRFACELAKEGHHVPEKYCDYLLARFHEANPGIRNVFHAYVQKRLNTDRCLTSPFGRIRQFIGLRPFNDNHKIFKEGYAQIPQSTVGDNTGMSVLWIETNHPGYVVMETHDSVTLETADSPEEVLEATRWLAQSFERVITFENGLQLTIPIEYEVGFNLKDMKTLKCENLTLDGLSLILDSLRPPARAHASIISGVRQPLSAQHSNVTYG